MKFNLPLTPPPALSKFWSQRTQREQIVLIAGSALLLLSLAYAYLWSPYSKRQAELQLQLPALRQEVQHAGDVLAAPVGGQQPLTLPNSALPAQVLSSFAACQLLAPPTLLPSDSKPIKLQIDKAALNPLLQCLNQVSHMHKLSVAQLRLDALPEPGMVRAEIGFAP